MRWQKNRKGRLMNTNSENEKPAFAAPALKETLNSQTDEIKITKKQRRSNSEFAEQSPVLRGFRIGANLVVYCDRCDRFHVHGSNPKDDSRIESLRLAHCGGGSSYRIAPFRQRDLKMIERLIQWHLGLDFPLTELAIASKQRVERDRNRHKRKEEQ
jgi:hypothetical protein